MSDSDKDNNIFHPKKLNEGEEVSLGIPAPQPQPRAEIVKRPPHKRQPEIKNQSRWNHDSGPKEHIKRGDIKIAPHARGDLSSQHHAIKHESKEHEKPDSHPQINLMPEHYRKDIQHETMGKKEKAKARLRAIRSHKYWHNAKLLIGTVLIFLLIFNSQWFISQIMFFFNKPKSQPTVQTTPAQTAQAPQESQAEIVGPENVIIIPKINVSAPLVFPKTTNEADVLVALRDGVVHYYGTAMPGENGNAAFFGHSSNDWWEPGNYKFVFVILEQLAAGDTYEIHYNSRKYVYQVTETKVVAPNDLSVLNQTAEPTSTLITCTPPGTSWRRFVVSAKQISPQPKVAEAKKEVQQVQNSSQQLPSASPSIWEQIKTFFGGLFGKKQETTINQVKPAVKDKHLPEVN